MSVIELVGICGGTPDPAAREILGRCPAVVAGRRHRSLLAGHRGIHIPMTPLADMVHRLEEALDRGDVCVLASGDPLFFGIGRTLLAHFPPERLRIHPALSAVQLACARFRVPWDDLVFRSLHGREHIDLPGRILSHPRVMLFTDPGNSPDRVAAALLAYLREIGADRLAETIRVRVAENLGMADERLHDGNLAEIAATTFSSLNLVLVEQAAAPGPLFRFGLHEDELYHSRGLITKSEVRAAILHGLRLPESGVFWDVGGGSGSVSVEAARLCPELTVCCVERRPEEQENIRRNIRKFRTWNVRLVTGTAPGALAALPGPDRVFIGGSGGHLQAIIEVSASRLRPGGRLVVSAVQEQTAARAPGWLAQAGLQVHQSRIRVSRWQDDETDARVFNPITLITGEK